MTQFETLTFESITEVNANHQNLNAGADEVLAEVGIHLDSKPKATVKASIQTHAKASLKAYDDTGTQGDILPLRLYRAMYPCKIYQKGNPKKELQSILILFSQHMGDPSYTIMAPSPLIANSKAKDLLAKALLSLAYQRRLISTL
jgi:hypothetical protein